MISCHSPIIDPREKWICQDELIQLNFNINFLGIGLCSEIWGNAKITGIDLPKLSVKLLIKNFIFIIKNREYLSRHFLFLAFISLPIALLLCVMHQTKREQGLNNSLNISTKINHKFHLSKLFRLLATYLIDNKNLGTIIRVPWKIHHIIIHRNKTILDYIEIANLIPDVIHGNDFDTYVVSAILKKKNKIRLIYDSQEFFPYSNPVFSLLERKVYSNIDADYCHTADAVITVSPHLGELMKASYRLDAVYIVPNACPKFEIPQETISARINDRIKFVFQGNFSLNRGLEFILETWAKYNFSAVADLYLIGPESRHKENLIRLSRGLKILDNGVFFPEAVSPLLLNQNLVNYDIGIIPYPPIDYNFQHCCPNKLSQYMSAGLAVLSNELSFVSEVISKGNFGLWFQAGNSDSFKQAFEKIVTRTTLIEFKEASKNFHNLSFNWSNFNHKLLLLYKNQEPLNEDSFETLFRFKL